jgi:hypothetical protein
MTDASLSTTGLRSTLRHLWQDQRVWLASALILGALAVFDNGQAADSARFAGQALLSTAPFLVLSITIAAWAGATGADNLIAKAFTGAPLLMIGLGALAGGISPFCSCGVIPLIAALLTMGVPLSAVMAFWLAPPIMDPSMFVLTAGVLDLEFAVGKTLAAIGLGVFGGLMVLVLSRSGALADPLRDGIGNGGCGGTRARAQGRGMALLARPGAPRKIREDRPVHNAVSGQMADAGLHSGKSDGGMDSSRNGDGNAGRRWFAADPHRDADRHPGLSEWLCCLAAGGRADRSGYGTGCRHGLPCCRRRHLDPGGYGRLGAVQTKGLCAAHRDVADRCFCLGSAVPTLDIHRMKARGEVFSLVAYCWKDLSA